MEMPEFAISLKETRFYQEVHQEGYLDGQKEGRLEGRKQGHQEGLREGLRWEHLSFVNLSKISPHPPAPSPTKGEGSRIKVPLLTWERDLG